MNQIPVLRTQIHGANERVLLRPLTPADTLDLFAIYGDTDTMRHASDEPFPSPDTVALMLESVATLLARQESFEWGIECTRTGQLIGTCGLHGFDEARQSAEVGCLLRRDRWGLGLMPEALGLLFHWARQQGLHTLRADIDAGNVRSQALFRRLGFTPDDQGMWWLKLPETPGLRPCGPTSPPGLLRTVQEAECAIRRADLQCTMPTPKPPGAPPAQTDQPNTAQAHADALITSLCRFIATCDAPPTLAELAAHSGLSEMQVQRRFKAATGLTPRAWADLERADRLRDALSQSPRITDALYEAGFGSSSRLYERADLLLGMQPTQYRQGGSRVCMQVAVAQSRLGAVLVARSARGLCAILMGDEAQALMEDLQRRFPRAELVPGDAAFDAQVVGFVQQPSLGLALPLDLQGTAFQRRVWQALRDIPAGHTVTYAELAQRIGSPKAVRAVAGACAANPVAVAVPCHRVVRSDGSLSGYRWGVERKRALLLIEASQTSVSGA